MNLTPTINHSQLGVTMKTTGKLLVAFSLLVSLVTVGCHKDVGGPTEAAPTGVTNEVQAMKYYAANDEFVENDETTIADNSEQNFDYGTFGVSKTDAAIIPYRWGRFITSVTKTVTMTVQPGDSIAIAVVDKTINGTLKIRAKVNPTDTAFVEISKPFVDQSKRNIIFKRVAKNTERFWLNWVPVASSLVAGGTSSPAQDIHIDKVQIVRASGDTLTITDPLATYLRYRWLKFWVGASRDDVPDLQAGAALLMRVTVTSAEADTDYVFLRYGCTVLERRRLPLECVSVTDNGNGTYTRVFQSFGGHRLLAPMVHFHRGYFNLALDAVTKATLFNDDVNKYSVSWWGVPYRVQ
jgi:hypothetical protein